MEKHFDKDLVMTKEDNGDFENSAKCCDNYYADNYVKVKDHCHITGKYRGCAHRDCNINLKLNHKIPAAFHNLKICDSHIVIQELGKMRHYHNLYLKCEFSLLPDVLEKFRNNSLKNY